VAVVGVLSCSSILLIVRELLMQLNVGSLCTTQLATSYMPARYKGAGKSAQQGRVPRPPDGPRQYTREPDCAAIMEHVQGLAPFVPYASIYSRIVGPVAVEGSCRRLRSGTVQCNKAL
jgi:hypothetical protein